VENDPRSWIVREGDPPSEPTAYPDYPHPEATGVRMHLRAGGRTTGALVTDATPGRGTEAVVDDASFGGGALASADSSAHRLLYVTPELVRPAHVSGVPRVTIRMASNRPAANLSVWLVTLPWTEGGEEVDNVITRGWADPQNHASLTDGEPLEPGRFYDVTFDLQPDDQIIPAGKRIGLMIFSSDHDFTLHPAPGTELTIDLAGTSLELPVVGGAATLSRPVG
jgi:X-Pro dipeptidyl-peptidase